MMSPKCRWSVAGGLAVTLLFLLSGCVKLDMDLAVHKDNTVDGTLIIAVDKQVLAATGQTEEQLLKQFSTQGPFSGKDRPKQGSFTQRPYDVGGKIGQTYTFTAVPLSEFAGGEDGLSITRKGDRFFVTGVVDMSTASPSDDAEKAIAQKYGKTAEIRIRITFPGEVLKSNGKIDGRSVTWNPKLGEKTQISAEARSSAIIPRLLAAAGGGVLLLIVMALVIFLVLRGRRGHAPDPAGGYGTVDDAGGYSAGYPSAGHYPPAAPPFGGYPPANVTQPLPRIDPHEAWPPSGPTGS